MYMSSSTPYIQKKKYKIIRNKHTKKNEKTKYKTYVKKRKKKNAHLGQAGMEVCKNDTWTMILEKYVHNIIKYKGTHKDKNTIKIIIKLILFKFVQNKRYVILIKKISVYCKITSVPLWYMDNPYLYSRRSKTPLLFLLLFRFPIIYILNF